MMFIKLMILKKQNERGKIPWITKGILISKKKKTENKLYKIV